MATVSRGAEVDRPGSDAVMHEPDPTDREETRRGHPWGRQLSPLLGGFIASWFRSCAAVIFYGGWLLVISLIFSALWASIASDRSLLKPDVSEKEVNAIARATTPSLGFYVAVIVLAFLAPSSGIS